jgi:F-type H+-transporting ATPase subunit delta
MTHFRVARRYARALLTLAEESGRIEKISGDMETIRKAIRASRELELFLVNPVVHAEKKQRILREIFGKKINSLTLQFLMLVTGKGRENALPAIIEQFGLLVDEKLGIVRVEVSSVVAFDKKQQKKLIGQLEQYVSRTVIAQFSLDNRLQGGFVARLGDTVIDASIKRQLELLRNRFIGDRSVTN